MAIREKISAALQDMPENEEIKQLLMGSCQSLLGLTYWNRIYMLQRCAVLYVKCVIVFFKLAALVC